MALKIRELTRALEPIEWPDGTEQVVRPITFDAQELLDDVQSNARTVRDVMPEIMPLLLPGKTWAEIRTALDADAMAAVITYASGKLELVRAAIGEAGGNVEAGTAPASPPPTPAPTSSPALPAPTGVPCET